MALVTAERRRRSSSIVELLLPLPSSARDPERVLELLLPTFSPIARALGPFSRWTAQVMSAKRPTAATTPDEAAEEASEATKAYLNDRRAGGAHRGRGAAAAPEHRRLRRHAGPRSDDAAARHRRHPGGGDDRRPARAVPRAGVFAVSGVQGEPRQHRGLRVREGSGRARAAPTTRGRSPRCCARR